MMVKTVFILFLIITFFACSNVKEDDASVVQYFNDTVLVYSVINNDTLLLEVDYPDSAKKSVDYPSIILIHGGGWKSGSPDLVRGQAEYFASRGMVTFLVHYRTENKHGVDPRECVKDVKSAVRYIKTNAKNLGLADGFMAISGTSAGGHLTMACAVIDSFNHASDELHVSTKPNLMLMIHPVVNNGPGGYGYKRVQSYYHYFSPIHNLKENMPPMLVLTGTKDKLWSEVEAKTFYKAVKDKHGDIELFLYPGKPHGFFLNKSDGSFNHTLYQYDLFLQKHGYIQGDPLFELPVDVEFNKYED